jgi:ribonucleoside-diphosphate reductase alpha chain
MHKREIKVEDNQYTVLKKRYLKKDDNGEPIESVSDMFERVALHVSQADKIYNKTLDLDKSSQTFYDMMADFYFMPNSPTLMNAGRDLGQLSACFVLPIEDSIESIFGTAKYAALIHKSGGGTGFSFSRLRPKNDIVKTTSGVASGPCSFIYVMNLYTEVVKQGGTRRGANMGILRVDHPDIIEFINIKKNPDFKNAGIASSLEQLIKDAAIVMRQDIGDVKKRVDQLLVENYQLNNFNISVALTNEFLRALETGGNYKLVNPSNGKVVQELPAKEVFDQIVNNAWNNGEPGIIFLDKMNEYNPTPSLGAIESTNPCGEQPLLPYESCNLGSLNLSKMIKTENGKKEIDWHKIEKVTREATHFMDNVIDMNRYPPVYNFEHVKDDMYRRVNPIEQMTKGNRKLGLGVMGLADMLIQLRIPYNSEDGIRTGEEIMKFVRQNARISSAELATQRGRFPNFKDSIYDRDSKNFKGEYAELRNATLTTIAPTGTISMIADASSGIEPIFDIVYTKTVMDKDRLVYFNPNLEEALKEGNYTSILEKMDKVNGRKKDKELEKILIDIKKSLPSEVKDVFVTAHEIAPEEHMKMQAAFQKYTDNAVSKTINFPKTASMDDVENSYILAHKMGCKGLTVYRDQSRTAQVYETLSVSEKKTEEKNAKRPKIMLGITRRERIGTESGEAGSLFVTVNYRENPDLEKVIEHLIKHEEPIELFTNSDSFDARLYSAITVIGKTISRGLRKGLFDLNFAVSNMEKLPADEPGYDEGFPGGKTYVNNNYIEAIQKVLTHFAYPPLLEAHKEEEKPEPKKSNGNSNESGKMSGKCKVCGVGNLISKEGCITCDNCGNSPKGCG